MSLSAKEDLSYHSQELKSPSERVHHLNTDSLLISDHPDITIVVGNTGMYLRSHIGNRSFELHFQPEGESQPAEDLAERLRRGAIFAGALDSFLAFHQRRKESFPQIAGGITNIPMAELIKHSVSKKDTKRYRERDIFIDDMVFKEYEFDIQPLLHDQAFRAEIKKVHAWLLRQNYKMRESVRDCIMKS